MSTPASHPEFSKNETGNPPDSTRPRNKERGSDDTEGSDDLNQDLNQELNLEYATSFRLIIIMATLSLSTLIAALDLVSIMDTQRTVLSEYLTPLT